MAAHTLLGRDLQGFQVMLRQPIPREAVRRSDPKMITLNRQEPARPRALDGRIPRDLETIVMKAIEKEPRRRYPSADALAEDGISARVIDLYSVKPVDVDGLFAAAEATDGRVVTVEDHWPEGGLGEAVLSAFAEAEEKPTVVKLAVTGMPGSGKPAELLAAAGIDADHIADAAKRLVGARAVA